MRCVKTGRAMSKEWSSSVCIRVPKATDMAAYYREKLELLGIQTSMCIRLLPTAHFLTMRKQIMDALREGILFKFVLKAPRKLSPIKRIWARRTEAWTHTSCSRENTVGVQCMCARAFSVGSERQIEVRDLSGCTACSWGPGFRSSPGYLLACWCSAQF